MEIFHPKKEQLQKKEKIKLQIDLESRQNEIKKLNKKYNIKMFTVVYVEKKHTLPNRKNFFFGVNDCITQLLLNFSIQEN